MQQKCDACKLTISRTSRGCDVRRARLTAQWGVSSKYSVVVLKPGGGSAEAFSPGWLKRSIAFRPAVPLDACLLLLIN